MSILKLKEAGESHTMTVTGCEQVKGQYGEQVKFDGDDGNTIFLPLESATRQLDRIGLDAETAVGERLTFSRDANPKKGSSPYWGITPAKAAPAPSKRIPPPSGAPPQGSGKLLPFDEGYEATQPGLPPNPHNKALHVGMGAPPNAPLQGEEDNEGPSPLSDKERAEDIQRAAIKKAYAELWQWCGIFQGAESRRGEFPVDGSSVNAMAFSIWGTWKDRGLVQGIASAALQRLAEAE